MKSGIVVLKKEEGITSQGAVNRVKRIFGADKAGHTGTLDPLATGVLPVLIGRAVKASEFLLTSDKYYKATLRLGIITDTEDITGTVISTCDKIPSEEEVFSAIESFIGEIMQTPPMYSALKVSGKKLCDLAREGKEIEREPRRITVHSIKAEKTDDTRYTLDVHCSKGTYIRTLCADIGKKLGTGGCMEALERSRAADFTLNDAHTLSELEAMNEEERESLIVPVERIFMKLPAVTLPPFFARLARCGLEIYLKKIGKAYEVGTMLRIYDEKGFFAIGEVREFEDGAAIKPVRQFDI
jgi:tRNA pseudouridine55 synthase